MTELHDFGNEYSRPVAVNDCKPIVLRDLSCFVGTYPLRQSITMQQEWTLAVGKSELVISDVSSSFLLSLPWNSVVNYDCSLQYSQNEADSCYISPMLTILLEVESDDVNLKLAKNNSNQLSMLPQDGLFLLALTSSASKFACSGIWQELEEKVGMKSHISGIGLPLWARTVIDKQCSWLLFPRIYKFLREDKNEKKILALLWVVALASSLLSLGSSVRNLYLAVPESRAVIDQAVHNLEFLMESFSMYISIITCLLLQAAYIVEMFVFPFCKSLLTILKPVMHVAKLTRNMMQPVGTLIWNIWSVLLRSAGILSAALNLAKGALFHLLTHFEPVSRVSLAIFRSVAAFISPLLATCLGAPAGQFALLARRVLLRSYLILRPTLQALARLVPRKIPLASLISTVSKAPLAISRATTAFVHLLGSNFGRLLAACLGGPVRQLAALTRPVLLVSYRMLRLMLLALARLVPSNLPTLLQSLLQADSGFSTAVLRLLQPGLCAASKAAQRLLQFRPLAMRLVRSPLALLAQGASASGEFARALCRAGMALAAWVPEFCTAASSFAQDCAALSELLCSAGLRRVLEWIQDPGAALVDQTSESPKAVSTTISLGNPQERSADDDVLLGPTEEARNVLLAQLPQVPPVTLSFASTAPSHLLVKTAASSSPKIINAGKN